MRIGIMGGTFNPPHTGHINAAVAAREELSLSRLIFIPSSLPPHKKISENSASTEQRLFMTKLCAESISAEVSDMEIVRGGTSYTVETLSELKKEYPDDELWFIMGTDMFLSIENWREPEKIFSLCSIAAVPRNDDDREKLINHSKYLSERYGTVSKVMKKAAIDISSSELREKIANGETKEFLPEAVYQYILKEGLYGV